MCFLLKRKYPCIWTTYIHNSFSCSSNQEATPSSHILDFCEFFPEQWTCRTSLHVDRSIKRVKSNSRSCSQQRYFIHQRTKSSFEIFILHYKRTERRFGVSKPPPIKIICTSIWEHHNAIPVRSKRISTSLKLKYYGRSTISARRPKTQYSRPWWMNFGRPF